MNTGFKVYLSVSEVAKLKGQTSQGIRKAIKEGRIKAIRIGNQWAIDRAELLEMLREESNA